MDKQLSNGLEERVCDQEKVDFEALSFLMLFPSSEAHAEFNSEALTSTAASRMITPIHPR